MKIFLTILFCLFVIAFAVFLIMWICSLCKSKKQRMLGMPKAYWVGLFGVQGSALCVNILNIIIQSIS